MDVWDTARRARFQAVAPSGLTVRTADEFLLWVEATYPLLVERVLERQVDYFRRKDHITKTQAGQGLVAHLAEAGAPGFARQVAERVRS
ncbi:hypothetical protein [Symbioplanes lichenis]|uniref:hypothetical protein n=1 Tax=Symbioplanes lichenis TaxID=1629072 RepID=UPI002739E2DF|nr:hypothetical protein [Actinoplanes lichenis]